MARTCPRMVKIAAVVLALYGLATLLLFSNWSTPIKSIHKDSSRNILFTTVEATNITEIPKRKVLITTLPRSGSTFLGEFFRWDDTLVYLFEVTRGFSEDFYFDSCSSTPVNENVTGLVTSIFDCNFQPLKKLMHVNQEPVFYTYPHAFNYSSPPERLEWCLPSETEGSEQKIQRLQKPVVLKEITFWAPKSQWLLDTLGPEFRMLWLVRDVRGWVSSWINWANDTYGLYEEFGYHKVNFWPRYAGCSPLNKLFTKKHLSLLQGLLSNTSAPVHARMAAYWTVETALSTYYFRTLPKGVCMLVLYEHLAGNPLEVAQQIYQFLGYKIVHDPVLSWIVDSTKKGNPAVRFGTQRHAHSMLSVHKTRLTPQQLEEVENIAEPLFSYFGYVRIT